ncbi:unnamed protein product [Mytilus coruscus]|uniref:Mab-21-like HhH/H2TH-like domain-containing protein n=1 Tax=Mytilus coruscus TaxID=42192 RepID=A0A6J8DW97_MYTCO|nr:unnamed protein product [Mytilus coruscus]
MPGSDLDIMLVSKEHIVHETIPQLGNKLHHSNILSLIIDYDNAQPGFVLLRVYDKPQNDFDKSSILRSEEGLYYSSKLYLQNLASKYPHCNICGPCLSSTARAVDVAHSLKCKKWPIVARKWSSRYRSSDWPSAILFSKIAKEPVLLVPIGKKIIRCTFNSDLQPRHCGYQEFDKAVFPLFGVFEFSFCDVKYSTFAESYKKCICLLTRTNLPTKVRILFTIFLSRISQFALDSVSEIDVRNKQMYKQHTKKRSTSLFLSKLSGVQGWVSLALNLYLCGQYKKAFIVLEYAKSVSLQSESIIWSLTNKGNATQDTLHLYHIEGYISQMRRLICHSKFKQTDFYVCNIHTYDYLLQLNPQQNIILLPTEVLIHYLRFACCHHLQDIFQRQQCLHDLTLIVESSISDSYSSSCCSSYLFHAYQIAYDRDFEQRVCEVFRTEKLLKSFSR